MDLYDAWLKGAFLAVWGVALLLAYMSLQRLFNLAHLRAYERGYVGRPRHIWPPVHRQTDAAVAIFGLILAVGAIAASNISAAELLGTPNWPPQPWRDTFYGLIRAHAVLALELFFLRKIAERPRFRSNWVVAWYVFSVGLAFWG